MRRSGNSLITAISSAKPLLSSGVQALQHRCEKRLVLRHTGEIHAAAQHQLLRHSPLEAMMPLLHIAVLVAMTGLRSSRSPVRSNASGPGSDP